MELKEKRPDDGGDEGASPNGNMTAYIGPKMAGSGDTEILGGKEGLIERTPTDVAQMRQAGGPDAGDDAREEATPGDEPEDQPPLKGAGDSKPLSGAAQNYKAPAAETKTTKK